MARLNGAGFDVVICTNQPEVARGTMSHDQLDAVRIGHILCCTCERKTPRMKPASGMLREALASYGAKAADTPFVGDQLDDLKAAFHAGCPRVLVRTGLGRKALEDGLPQYLEPVAVHDDLAAAVDAHLRNQAGRSDIPPER